MEHHSKLTPVVDSKNEEVLFQWDHRIKMLFNPVLWGNFLAGFGIPALILGIAMSFPAGVARGFLFSGVLLAFFFVIWVLTGIVMDLAGGFSARFAITDRGIYFTSGKGSKAVANTATLVGVLAGSAVTTGAGLLAKSEQDGAIEWKNLKKVKVRKGMRYIFVREGFGNKPIGLYCNKENFEPVLALIQSKLKR
ncbi:MAG: hypothetical protein V1882_02345 [Candidatus Omnitrophota bacterium]